MAHHWIFGYGSLIDRDSRQRTLQCTNVAIPVTITGFRRGWVVPSHEMSLTGVGVFVERDSCCNGILFDVDELGLVNLDSRELGDSNQNYSRIPVGRDQILGITNHPSLVDDDTVIWVYVVVNPVLPTLEYPIVQSYVDVILAGCSVQGEKFTKQFIQSTDGWQYPWINDRNIPRYKRFLETDSHINAIDKILFDCIPNQFQDRRN